MMAGFLKHESVEEVVLYEIDEVRDNSHIRSNNTPTYFIIKLLCGSQSSSSPHMSSLPANARVTVFSGDSFKFLADNTTTYDPIITNSSDPVGATASVCKNPTSSSFAMLSSQGMKHRK